jgi:DNA modification methylase
MNQMDAESVHAIVCDPPYGLEFMGKDWDKFSPVDLDRGGRWIRENRGAPGSLTDAEKKGGFGSVALGANRSYTSVCQGCGRRDAFRNDHDCAGEISWRRVPVDDGPPPQMVAFQEWTRQWAEAALRVLKPGGHLLAFGGTRTYHRLASGLEDAGFEIRDSLHWIYGSG